MSLYMAARAAIGPAARALWPLRVEGVHHVPERGPVILAANHLALIDPLFLGVAAPREIIFVAKKELFSQRTVARRAFGGALRAIGQISVERRPGQGAREAMDAGLTILKQDRVFGIFPEGTRSPDGRLYRGHTGLAWLALSSGAPVIPVAMARTDRILPRGRRVPSFNRVGVRFGPPVDLSPWVGEADRARSRRAATDAVMAAIQRLSGQERVARYAASVKAELDRRS